MGNNENMHDTDKMKFLENELGRMETNLAQGRREIEVEAALEKVREKALSMRSSAELSETSTILFQQLKEIKIDVIRSGVGIFDDENNAIELWITSVSKEGRLFFILDYINIHVHPVFENIINSREENKSFAVTNLAGDDLQNYYKTMSTYAGISEKRESSHSEYFYSFFFSAGTINAVTSKNLTNEEIQIMLRITQVFGLIYTRFLDLKKLEEQSSVIKEEKRVLETTLNNLRNTQSQLVHAEKMASLGELTAGIAHEIQNPLNFVNNFSDLNKELLQEMKEEISNGNLDAANSIANNVIENEEKINHHGKRADAIVKGMLQHSRSHTGVKEPTDINALCNEYLRLAYHGIRAKEKDFNSTIQTDFDTTIGAINVIPQDISRVILNLINNAFYAVNEKLRTESQKQDGSGTGYQPAITVSTKKTEDRIEIHVQDNGNGISLKILDKIFQPFFTTKPTGQGTGLGLSLSYDIIKAHGGDIKVITKEEEGSEFIIELPTN